MSQREKTKRPAVLDRISGPGTWDDYCLSAGLRRHDRRVVMVMMAVGQRGLHNVLIIGACDKDCQSLSVKNSLRDCRNRSVYLNVSIHMESYVLIQ